MLDQFDTTSAPRRPTELLALVEAVHGALDTDESHWLEWKSRLDLTSAHGRGHIARAILGFSNRRPDVAARAVDGHGYLLVGVSPGKYAGVEAVDSVDLDQGLAPYLGREGPQWTPHYLRIHGVDVLVIDVEPPKDGDPIFVAQRTTEGLTAGRVYVRRTASTEHADAAEMAGLQLRLLARASQFVVEVDAQPTEIRPVQFSQEHQEIWLSEQRDSLLSALPTAPTPSASRRFTAEAAAPSDEPKLSLRERVQIARAAADLAKAVAPLAQMQDQIGKIFETAQGAWERPEERSVDDYTNEVENYIATLRAALPGALRAAAATLLQPISVTLINPTDHNRQGVELVLSLPAGVDCVVADEDADPEDLLPSRPRQWGPSPITSPRRNAGSLSFYTSVPAASTFRPTPQIARGGDLTKVTFPSVHIRPRLCEVLDSVVLVVDSSIASFSVPWSATSDRQGGVARGTLHFTTAGGPLTLVALAQK